jgi:hypothetical protein
MDLQREMKITILDKWHTTTKVQSCYCWVLWTLPHMSCLGIMVLFLAHLYGVYHAPMTMFDAIDNDFYRALTLLPRGFHAYYLMFVMEHPKVLRLTWHGFGTWSQSFEEHSTYPIVGFMAHVLRSTNTHCRFGGVVCLGRWMRLFTSFLHDDLSLFSGYAQFWWISVCQWVFCTWFRWFDLWMRVDHIISLSESTLMIEVSIMILWW